MAGIVPYYSLTRVLIEAQLGTLNAARNDTDRARPSVNYASAVLTQDTSARKDFGWVTCGQAKEKIQNVELNQNGNPGRSDLTAYGPNCGACPWANAQ